MADVNFIKIENVGRFDLSFLLPKNWRKKNYTKETVKILFVDDEDMPIADNLKRSLWDVKKIKDIKDINADDVASRQIIFVDYDGVGRSISSQHQGAGLVKELKEKYGDSKYLVLYTSQKVLPSDTFLKSLFEYADARLPKDADETDFLDVIRDALEKLK